MHVEMTLSSKVCAQMTPRSACTDHPLKAPSEVRLQMILGAPREVSVEMTLAGPSEVPVEMTLGAPSEVPVEMTLGAPSEVPVQMISDQFHVGAFLVCPCVLA